MVGQVPNVQDTGVTARLDIIRQKLHQNPGAAALAPGLLPTLDTYIDEDFEPGELLRRLLQIYKKSDVDSAYQDVVAALTEDERRRIEKFVDEDIPIDEVGVGFKIPSSMAARHEMTSLCSTHHAVVSPSRHGFFKFEKSGDQVSKVDFVPESSSPIHEIVSWFKNIFHSGHKGEIKVWENTEFWNWGQTVHFEPRYTLWPKTTDDVQAIVKFARDHDMSVRCSGYRHSWSPIFGRQKQIMISLLDPEKVSTLPNTESLKFLYEAEPTELETIEIVKDRAPIKPKNTLVRVGAACTNERLRRWCVKHDKVTLPLNVIMVEITLGGSNAPICHGAGRRNKTLSDLVRVIEYVDAHGQLRVVDNMDELRAASGCFGLMGVVTHITLEFDPMTYAILDPTKIPMISAIPPPPDMKDEDIPRALRQARTPEERKRDQEEFERRAANDYYSEWFWFPYQDKAWVNTWNATAKRPDDIKDFPSNTSIFISWAGTVLMNVAQYSKVLDTVGKTIGIDFTGTTIISSNAMKLLPSTRTETYLCDALHFQRAIQNVRVRDVEVEMPLVPVSKNKPDVVDWSIVQRAWWDAVIVAYKHVDTSPMRMPLEMRIMGGSDVIMAPQRGNTLGTCSIEVLTLESEKDTWIAFAQEVLDKWMSYHDSEGRRLKTRPHWSKEWRDLNVDGKRWIERLREDYKDDVVEFKQKLAQIGKEHGWTLADIQQRFSNEFFDDFIFG